MMDWVGALPYPWCPPQTLLISAPVAVPGLEPVLRVLRPLAA